MPHRRLAHAAICEPVHGKDRHVVTAAVRLDGSVPQKKRQQVVQQLPHPDTWTLRRTTGGQFTPICVAGVGQQAISAGPPVVQQNE
jgi:hypothetical protein